VRKESEKRNSLLEDIRPLAKEPQRRKKKAEALGLFTDDRELLMLWHRIDFQNSIRPLLVS